MRNGNMKDAELKKLAEEARKGSARAYLDGCSPAVVLSLLRRIEKLKTVMTIVFDMLGDAMDADEAAQAEAEGK